MRYVDHDAGASARAAAACREGADRLRSAANRVGESTHRIDWYGADATRLRRRAVELTERLRAEARSLDATADELTRATRRAWDEDSRRAAEARARARREAEARAAAECATGPSIGHRQPGSRR